MGQGLRAWLLGLAGLVLLASRDLIAVEAMPDASVLAASALRGLLGGAVLAVVFRHDVKNELSMKDLVAAALAGTMALLVAPTLFLAATGGLNDGTTEVLVRATPLFVMGLALTVRQESLSPLRTIAIIAGVGITIFAVTRDHSLSPFNDPTALVLGVFGVLATAGALVLSKRILESASPSTFSALFLLTGGIVTGFMTAAELPEVIESAFGSAKAAALVAADLALGTAAGYYLFFKSVSALKASTVGTLLFLQVPIATLLDALISGSSMSMLPLITGGLLLLTSLIALYANDQG